MSTRTAGWSAIALGIGFNIPYALLSLRFDYPAVLRRAPDEIIDAYAAGGPVLVLIWWSFMLAALALVPVGSALSVTPARLAARPALAIGGALFAALAGIAQAIGLARWVFVVPSLHGPGAAEQLALLNAYGGVAIGEHLGQALTALFVAAVARMQWHEAHRRLASLGAGTAAMLATGTLEGLAIALHADGSGFALVTIAAYLGLTAWLIATGVRLIGTSRPG